MLLSSQTGGKGYSEASNIKNRNSLKGSSDGGEGLE
jgi:hypothetical protein